MATEESLHELLFIVKGPEGRKPETLDCSPISVYHTPVSPAIPLSFLALCSPHYVCHQSLCPLSLPLDLLTVPPFSPGLLPSSPVLKGGYRGCDWLALLMG